MLGIEEDPEMKAGVTDVDLSDTQVLVTGSTNGLGRQAALALGRLGADVIVHGRDEQAGQSAVEALEAVGSDAQFMAADFASTEAVDELAAEVESAVDELDVLCNNAGGLFEDTATTDLGVERTFHINHLSPFQLTTRLLEADALAPDARIVTTASIGHRLTSMNLDRLIDMTNFSPWAAYCRSKLANLRFSNELARRLEARGSDVTSNALHPGIIPSTEFSWGPIPGVEQFGSLLEEFPLADSPEDGAATIVYLAASDEVAGVSGKYFARCRERKPAPNARDEEEMRALWERSASLLGIDEPLAVD